LIGDRSDGSFENLFDPLLVEQLFESLRQVDGLVSDRGVVFDLSHQRLLALAEVDPQFSQALHRTVILVPVRLIFADWRARHG